MKKNERQITFQEKELLRRAMEDDEICKKWDFFKGLNWQTPPPETFMVGEPERKRAYLSWLAAVLAGGTALWGLRRLVRLFKE